MKRSAELEEDYGHCTGATFFAFGDILKDDPRLVLDAEKDLGVRTFLRSGKDYRLGSSCLR